MFHVHRSALPPVDVKVSAPARKVFLIVEPDVLIADDLRETLEALDPAVVVARARDAAGAQVVLEGMDRLSAAFLSLPSRELAASGLPRMVEARGGHVVVLDAPGDAVCADGAHPARTCPERPAWLYTGRPYAARTIAGVLRDMAALSG